MPRAAVRVRVPFADVDSSDRIHFTAMLRYFEIAEHALMRGLGLPYATTLVDLAFPRVHIDCDFHGAIQYDDLLDVEASVAHVGTRSWTVEFAAWPGADGGELASGNVNSTAGLLPREGRPLASGHMTIVAMDPLTERATALPDTVRDALTREE